MRIAAVAAKKDGKDPNWERREDNRDKTPMFSYQDGRGANGYLYG